VIVVPLTASATLLDLIRAEWLINPPNLHLYKNDTSPTVLSTLANFDECDFPGYTAAPLAFGPAVIVATDHAELEADAIVFTCNADPGPAQRVFGIYILDSTDTELIFAERLDRRFFMRLANDKLSIVCKFGGLSEFTG